MSPSPSAEKPRLGRNVIVLTAVSLLTDVASEMAYPLLPVFLATVLGASAMSVGAIEGAAESTAALLRLASGWWSDRLRRRKPLVVLGYGLASAVRPLIGLARSTGQVLAIRIADRVGKGIRTSPRDALIADSVDPAVRGRAFGFHRAGDNLGAFFGPLLAFALLRWERVDLRTVFLLTAVPAALSVTLLVFGLRETPRRAPAPAARLELSGELPGRFWAYLGVVLVFTLGNSTDAFLLLRASQLGVATALVPILWALLNLVKALASTPGGALSDRVGRKLPILAGWLLYAAVYLAFGRAHAQWQAWALFAVYGVFFGLTEGVEKALVADLVPAERRGAAFGFHNLTIGVAALPASLLFGAIWDRRGAPAAFTFGAALALVAAAGIAAVVPTRSSAA
jgi:MFS family permease